MIYDEVALDQFDKGWDLFDAITEDYYPTMEIGATWSAGKWDNIDDRIRGRQEYYRNQARDSRNGPEIARFAKQQADARGKSIARAHTHHEAAKERERAAFIKARKRGMRANAAEYGGA